MNGSLSISPLHIATRSILNARTTGVIEPSTPGSVTVTAFQRTVTMTSNISAIETIDDACSPINLLGDTIQGAPSGSSSLVRRLHPSASKP